MRHGGYALTGLGLLTVLIILLPPFKAQLLALRSPPPNPADPLGSLQQLPSGAELQRASSRGAANAETTVWLFLSPHCPISNAYIPELNRIAEQFISEHVSLIGVVPSSMASESDVTAFRRRYEPAFPVMIDRDHQLCRLMQATHTPMAIVRHNGEVIYSGRIDNRFADLGKPRARTSETNLINVLNSLQSGAVAHFESTTPIGCLIEQPPKSQTPDSANLRNKLTFNRDVAPIMFESCSSCHRPGEAAPFPLLTSEDFSQHADQIAVVVERGLMPPWKPEPDYAEFRNERRLTAKSKRILLDWISSDRTIGDPSELPEPPDFPDGWQLGQPDLVLEMPEAFEVPADGPDIYQHFVIPTNLTEDRLVNAVEFRPGAPEVVHHSIIYFDTSGQGRTLDAEDPQPGYERMGSPGFAVTGSLGGWGPGGQPQPLPLGLGRPLAAQSDLIVQIHYHPVGRSMKDRSRIGLYFAPNSARHPVTEIMVANVDLTIEAGAARHAHHAEYTLPVDTVLFDATPHMHTLGREIRALAVRPDGQMVPLVWIKDWDFYWQDKYVFREPIELPAGTRIELDCWFDNSASNPLNPNQPPKIVRWGDFSTDEMGICYFQATTHNAADYRKLNDHATAYFRNLWEQSRK